MKEEFLVVFQMLGIHGYRPKEKRFYSTSDLVKVMREDEEYLEVQRSLLEYRLKNEGNLGEDMLWLLHCTTAYVSGVISGNVPILLKRDEVNDVAASQTTGESSDGALARHLRRVVADQVKSQATPISEAFVKKITDALHDSLAAGVPANGKYLTTNQIAARLGIAPKTVRRLCAAGQIRATKLAGGEWRATQSELEESPYLKSKSRRENASME